jgi:CRP-like cAMP-binding protein
MSNFIPFINALSQLTEEAADDLSNLLKTKMYNKGDHLLKSGTVCKCLYFVDSGLTKTYFNRADKEFIMRFFPEQALFTVLDSFLLQTPSTYAVVALEPTTVTYLSKTDLEDSLCKSHHCIETFFRKLVSFASINMMKRISEMLEENGTERYNHFVSENNHLMQRISLGDLANYLGITQVSLSRIRARK